MSDLPDTSSNAAQIDYWNAGVGDTWAELQALLDRQIEPLGQEAIRALAPRPGERILDIGCGCGQSSLELAACVGPEGGVVGIDISRPMLEVARARSASAPAPQFQELDAQTGDLGQGAFDAVYSRFGVMFFSDPVAAFANIRAALKPGGRLAFVCWRTPAENPVMIAPMMAAAPLLPPQPAPDPTAPGPFAFADAKRLQGILAEAGFSDISLAPFDAGVGAGDLDQTMAVTFRIGPLGRALRENPDRREAVVEVVRAAIAPFVTPDGVRMQAGVWIVTARNG